jgi:peptidoglycan hydrolase-like amidase
VAAFVLLYAAIQRLGLPSIHFTAEKPDEPDTFVFSGGGWGTNVGMSQFGAYAMADYYARTTTFWPFIIRGFGLSRV